MINKSTKNALLAAGYIVIVATVMFYASNYAERSQSEDTVLAPMAIISLFTLSAAVMAYLFFWTPLELYLSGDKAGAVKTLLHTIVTFAVITAIIVALLIFV